MARPSRREPTSQSALLRVFSANAMLTVLGVTISLLLPLNLSPVDYGYWQLYALYVGYAGVFMFGFNDGVHLNYAGTHYGPDAFGIFRSFRIVVWLLSLLGAIFLAFVSVVLEDGARSLVVGGMAAYVLMTGLNGFCAYTNQNTLRFRQYSQGIVLERISFLLVTLALVALGAREYWWYIGASTIACSTLLMYNAYTSSELFRGPRASLRSLKREIRSNFSRGVILMLAVILNQSMIAVGRLVVENQFGIAAFGGYSFALTVLNVAGLVMVSVSQVMFPVIKRATGGEVARVSGLVDSSASVLGALLLLSYFPVWIIIDFAYGAYREMLSYLMFLFPLVIFQGKFQVVVVNGFKIAGRMSCFLVVSVAGILLELLLCFGSLSIYGTVRAVVIASVVGVVAQYYLGLAILRREPGWRMFSVNYLDLLTSVTFLVACLIPEHALGLAGWYGLCVSFGLYVALVAAAMVGHRKRVAGGLRDLRLFLSQ